ncbi:tRNA (cytidine(34)-2'-O)-methyltransferase [Actinidia rufa]|uniref:tRNA (Cytidine(34)-2'-O)-methyltransferase n=1 Tax=Actinidia rufa TaxID=165716 RepID=A0A7J0FPF1_9ERIC|nr:tRNA (cytidine(34)-2'-O)-methyltransferase [Actinidia rufa]
MQRFARSEAAKNMESSTGLRTLTTLTTPLHFRSRAFLFRPLHFAQLNSRFHFSLSSPSRSSPLCSISGGGNGSSWSDGVGEAVRDASKNKILQVVLVSPQIPGNTGTIARTCAASAVGLHLVADFSYRRGDWLVFGSETHGLPPEALLDFKSEALGAGTIRIPMVETYVRCLNLSVSVGIAVYEASRQLNYEQIQCPETCEDGDKSLFVEDIFA